MSIVKYDNELRDKIEGMNDVPSAFTFNPSVKWQQLENKLQPAPSKKKLVWLYWAAASLFIIFSTLIWLNGSKQIGIAAVSNSSKIITLQTNEIQQNAIVKQSKKQDNNNLKTIITSANNIAPSNDRTDTIEVINEASVATSSLILVNVMNTNVIDSIVQNDNIKAQVLFATIKPKRKVIHINDLVAAIPEPAIITKRDDKHIASQEEPTTPIETNKSWWLFKPKPTTVNTFTNTSLTENQ